MDFQILLYYKYISVNDPEALAEQQRQLCWELGLKGRIIVANEGINGTVEGLAGSTELYVEAMRADSRFADIHFKRSPGTGQAFPKLSVKVRPEIVSLQLGEADIDPRQVTGQYLQPEELHQWFEQGKEFYIVDMRNDYEHQVGHFADSILPPMHHFRQLPEVVESLAFLKDKPVVTVCTGGVRCEKASGFLLNQGFNQVYQLAGGIVSYMEKYPNQHFLGQLYVFDRRIVMGFATDASERTVVGRCELCAQPAERYVNCANLKCHRHFICCEECGPTNESAFCSQTCAELVAASI